MFDALLAGRIDTEGLEFDVAFADIEQLNDAVLGGRADVTKLSYAVLPDVTRAYKILNSGSALGRGNGPLLVGRECFSEQRLRVPGDAAADTDDPALMVAVPGLRTTANMLMFRLYPQITGKTPVLFSDIADLVARGDYDAGVLIHEGRFTYNEKGLRLVADLGAEWEAVTGLPLPLGAIAVSRRLDSDTQRRIDRVLRRSIEFAMADPLASSGFVRSHAQEMDENVIRSHIDLFVNEFSLDLGAEGGRAVRELTGVGGTDVFVEPSGTGRISSPL